MHAAEVFTTGASGLAHWWAGNVDKALLRRLAIPGMIGGAVGAYLLTTLLGSAIRPGVSVYLLAMGIFILWRAYHPRPAQGGMPRHIPALGLVGGFLDAIGGGGWGEMVTSTLIGQGVVPRLVIGSVNLAEFFVTIVVTATFIMTIGLELWPIITRLVLGGVIAAPFAALLTRHVPARVLMAMVGSMIVVLSVRGIIPSIKMSSKAPAKNGT